jgi:5,10-methylene-tetrahydrofolate dehydrogenase/methenyl tetrahydrofolate cyclohydrolase
MTSATPAETIVVDGLALAQSIRQELVGDVDTEGARGVGPMTITMLLRNTLSAHEERHSWRA